jgi:hypothetical protein
MYGPEAWDVSRRNRDGRTDSNRNGLRAKEPQDSRIGQSKEWSDKRNYGGGKGRCGRGAETTIVTDWTQ